MSRVPNIEYRKIICFVSNCRVAFPKLSVHFKTDQLGEKRNPEKLRKNVKNVKPVGWRRICHLVKSCVLTGFCVVASLTNCINILSWSQRAVVFNFLCYLVASFWLLQRWNYFLSSLQLFSVLSTYLLYIMDMGW